MKRFKTFKSFEDYVDWKYPFDNNLMRFIKKDPKLYNKVFEQEAKEYKKHLEFLERLETVPNFYKLGLASNH